MKNNLNIGNVKCYTVAMKIAIDIRSAGGEKTGKGQYTFQLTQNLLKLDAKNHYILYTKEKMPGFDDFPNVTLKMIPGFGPFWHRNVARDVHEEQCDIFFAPSSYITPVLIKKPTKVFVTVHDLVAFLFPQNNNKKATFIERIFLRKAIKRADKILAVSENTKSDLMQKFPKAEDKTSVIYCAASDLYTQVPKENLEKFAKDTNLPEKFFLAIGTIQPRKNYVNLLRAFAKIQIHQPNLHLVIVGQEGWQFEEVYGEIMHHNLSRHVHILGYLSESSIRNLYNLALALVFPSFYEGFGIPPLEAMQCGCPVISSSTSSLPEVVGDSALLVDPNSVKEIMDAMGKILHDKNIRQQLKEKGLKQADNFSWEKSAKQLLSQFQ